jgi:hypothetical protein
LKQNKFGFYGDEYRLLIQIVDILVYIDAVEEIKKTWGCQHKIEDWWND